ncbi:MAG: 30S ribosomal protein S5 [Candidatus Peregrinibacteria bacterium]
MPKSSRPDRKKPGNRRNEPKEFEETTLSVDRVTRVVKGGRRMRFRAIVVLGNKKGKVGLGTGKAMEVQEAVKKATSAARRSMIRVPIPEGTIPHEVNLKFKAARIRLLPAREGTGIIAGGAIRVILEHAGVRNVLSKRFGSSNKLVNAQATMLALQQLRGTPPPEEEKKTTLKETVAAEQDAEALSSERAGLEVKEVRREDVIEK